MSTSIRSSSRARVSFSYGSDGVAVARRERPPLNVLGADPHQAAHSRDNWSVRPYARPTARRRSPPPPTSAAGITEPGGVAGVSTPSSAGSRFESAISSPAPGRYELIVTAIAGGDTRLKNLTPRTSMTASRPIEEPRGGEKTERVFVAIEKTEVAAGDSG